MGDVDLAEVKKLYGDKLSFMGNLQTTSVMLRGTVEEVEAAARKAIDDAGVNGGFLLSTGDQCGRDTPEENIFKLVEVAKTYGKY
jgi:uroporphyrinogen decarboxylase